MQVDAIGITAVSNLIRQSNLNKFTINRYGVNAGAAPVFEHLTGSQNKRAVDAFVEWANNVLNSNPQNTQAYELFLFNTEGEDDGEETPIADIRKRSKLKRDKMRIYFSLASAQAAAQVSGDYVRREDMAKVISETLERNELLRQNKELSDRLSALENEEEEEEEEEIGGDLLGRVERIWDKINGITGKATPAQPAASGAGIGAPEKSEDELKEVKKNIQNAIGRLYKVNNQLDKDLLKLADIAEKNPSQFNFYMKALRNM